MKTHSAPNGESTEELLTFELTGDGTLEIHGNKHGLAGLRHALDHVLRTETHDHLMTREWGGNELSSDRQGDGNRLVHSVKILFWE